MVEVDSAATLQSLVKYREAVEAKLKSSIKTFMLTWTDWISDITPVGDDVNYDQLYAMRQQRYGWAPTAGMLMGNWTIRLNNHVAKFDPRRRDTTGESLNTAAFFWSEKYNIGDTIVLFNATPYLTGAGWNGNFQSIDQKYGISSEVTQAGIDAIMGFYRTTF